MKCTRCNEREAALNLRAHLCRDCTRETRPKCKHCQDRMAMANYHRGLCSRCFGDRSIRAQYATAHGKQQHGEPTEAELEQMIAEQMACLPPWWHASQKRYREEGVDD